MTIPESRTGKRITLFFERSKNSRVWVNDAFVGRENSLSAPHVLDVTQSLKPGRHTITVMIDNSKLPPVGPARQVDERTQTNWNGIVGRMELHATDPVWIDDARVYPDVSLYDYGKREGQLIFRHFGNSSSFTMFTLGNELGRTKGMFDLVSYFRKLEPRALHAQGANNMHWEPSHTESDDFRVPGKSGNQPNHCGVCFHCLISPMPTSRPIRPRPWWICASRLKMSRCH